MPARPTVEDIESHATEAARFFDLAIQLKPDDILAHLGRASFREQCLQFELSGLLPRRRVIEGLDEVTLEVVRDDYFLTFQKALSINVERDYLVGGWKETVCHEAGTAYLRLVSENPALANEQEDRVLEVEAGLQTLEQMPVGMVTPIIVGSEGKAYEDLLDDSTHGVMFDLDGNGRTERWPWVNGDTGILVWDPMKTGHVQSGHVAQQADRVTDGQLPLAADAVA